MLFTRSTWPEIEAFLQRSRAIVMPVGSTEQHGLSGCCGTDALCPETIALRAEARGDILVAPTLFFGMSQHHLGFPGTISITPLSYIAFINDIVSSLTASGFEHIYFLNGHGGNVPSLDAAISQAYAGHSYRREMASFKLHRRNWWQLPGIETMIDTMFGDDEGFHATASELSVMLDAYPPSNDWRMPPLDRGPDLTHVRDGMSFRHEYPDGHVGSNPSRASAELGHELLDAAARALLDDLDRFVAS